MEIKGLSRNTIPQAYLSQNSSNQAPEKISETKEKEENGVVIDRSKDIFKNPEELKKNLKKATEDINKMVKVFNRKIDFTIHDETERIMVKVVDTVDNKVIREIPPEEILNLIAKFKETFSIFFDVRV